MRKTKNRTTLHTNDSNAPEQTDEHVAAKERETPDLKKIPIKDITIDPEIQPRVRLDDLAIDDYAKAMKRGEKFPPLVVYQVGATLLLVDGFHSVEAYEAASIEEVEMNVYTGTKRDAMLHAAGCNATHELRRTNADKHRAVTRLLDDPEWRQWSSCEIARICRVSDTLVLGVRKSRPDYWDGKLLKFHTRHNTVGKRPLKTGKTPGPATASDTKPADTGAESPAENQEQTTSAVSASVDDIFDVAGSADNESASPLEDPIQPSPIESAVPENTPGNREPDFRDDALESIVRRAAEAAEAVLVLRDELGTVPQELLNRLHTAADSLAAVLRRRNIVKPPLQIPETPVPPSRGTYRRRDVGGGWPQARIW